ncbi:MAG: hypothetical protein GXC75_04175 [Xanthomonadaceae bacterium]|nr:hypothetical protein [Xanthomonadaceae bacterium]
MPDQASSRISVGAAALLLLVSSLILTPLGFFAFEVVARVTGGNLPPQVLVSPDPLSDSVSATAGEFRVDESGAATYSVPIYAVPGTTGVAPQLALTYSSQGAYGALGKGWALSGLSSITRCRATREAGDFLGGATSDGNPRPISFSEADRFCLDGQRLIASSASCPSAGGMSGIALATELESFTRVCAYTPAGGTTGPAFFTVERKDGSISWYGDRDSNSGGATRPDGYVEATSPLNPGAAISWAQTRFQDSTGNYIDYLYNENPSGAGTGEHHIREIRYTGKVALAGQSVSSAPYAKVQFNYSTLPSAQWSRGYFAGGMVTATQRLESITSCASAGTGCPTDQQARHYVLTYAPSPSGSGQDTLIGLQECRDNTAAVCSAATMFGWSTATHAFATYEAPPNLTLATDHFKNFKLGDINGDGRQDLAVLYLAGTGCSGGSWVISMLGTLNASGQPAYANATWNCVPANITERGEGAWHLFDYNGDGLDDLFVSSFTGQGWRVHPSNGVHFDMVTNLIAGLSPIVPSATAESSQVHLADLNGDGLTDIVYPTTGTLRARLMERQAGGFAWGAERSVIVDETTLPPPALGCDDPFDNMTRNCERTISGTLTTKTGFMQMVDFNGDAASDLLIRITTRADVFTGFPGCEIGPLERRVNDDGTPGFISRFHNDEEETGTAVAFSVPNDPCWERVTSDSLYALTVQAQTASTVSLAGFDVVSVGNPHAVVFADFNGDGLSDRAVRSTSNSEWGYALNNGRYFVGGGGLTLTDYRDQVRFLDVTADGRADMLYLVNYGTHKGYAVRRALPEGGFATGAALPGGNARLCQGSGCDQSKHVPIFGDVDGDGNMDFQALSFSGSTVGIAFSRSAQAFQPRDLITSITNGLGATTQLQYAPLTNTAIYRRSTGSRNGLNWGRGSPVVDLLAPTYVVAKASSSAPRAGNPAAMASLYYRYANARVQAGGRGFLGFGSVETIDPNQTGGHVVTMSTYAQNFPFTGMPMQTVKKAVTSPYSVSACLTATPGNGCFGGPGATHPDLGGQWFSNSVQSWEMAPSSLASQTPIHVRTQGSEESLRDPFTGEVTSKVATAFSYGSHGNVTQTVVDTYTGASTLTATQITQNTYSDDVGAWRLGRLTASTITHRRPGYPDVVRTAGFGYAMGGPKTGLLTLEQTQPGGAANLASAKAYALDEFGNRLQSVTCAAPETDCSLSGFVFQPSSLDAIRRYSRVEYDAQGRFPVATYEPFSDVMGSQERRTTYVVSRNIFGEATDVLDVNGVRSLAIKGALGRDYFSWTQTMPGASPGNGGITGTTTYRWCSGTGAVPCPVGAVFRQQIAATAAARQWTWFDVLGRPIMKAGETFNVGVIDQDVSATCTEYDGAGRVTKTSVPFFLSGTAGTTGPSDVGSVCSAPSRAWATTTYDLLGRPTLIQAPDGSQQSTQYAGRTTTAWDQRSNPTVQVVNGKGEVLSMQDASGFTTQFTYQADGNVASVARNAGAGTITNTFSYDVLGRKIQQVDPDTGTTTLEYNALGEVIAQTDNGGYRTEREIDARGRAWRITAKLPGGAIESQTTTQYDNQVNASGQPVMETTTGQYAAWAGQAGTATQYDRQFHYDPMGRPTGMSVILEEGMFGTEVQYDTLGRPWKARDASGAWSKTEFGARGARATCASDALDSDPSCSSAVDTYNRTLATDAWGNVSREIRAGQANMEVRRQYHALTGRLTQICAGNTACNLVQEGYVWDAAGNLASHQKEGRYLEQFTYDSLNRVTEGRLTMANGITVNQVLLANAYDQLGNICSKDGLGYGYPGADGCVGALPMAQATAIPALASQSTTMPSLFQRAATRAIAPALNRGQMLAPEARYRRYSADDDRPSWDDEAEGWSLGFEQPQGGGWQRRTRPARAASQQIALPTAGAQLAALTRTATTAAAVTSVANSPHAVNRTGDGAAATFYYYDDRGNQTLRDAPGSSNDRTIRYTADGKAHEIQMGNGQTTRFWYGPDGQRYKRQDGTTTTLYIGGVEILIQNGLQSARRYVAGVALQTVVGGIVQATKFLFHDHLGSLIRIANIDGSVAEALDYATFGARRAFGNPAGSGSASSNTPRGFTGHEYVDGTDVIHMNGRIYDATLGRFLQADPLIQAPTNGQSWNAYTYVFNNPLVYTDPTGNFSLRQALGLIIAIVGTIFMPYLAPVFTKLGAAMLVGFVSGYVSTGTLQGGLFGAFSAAVFYGIGTKFQQIQAANGADFKGVFGTGLTGDQFANKVLSHGVAGGVMSRLQGGKFGHGFLSAGVAELTAPMIDGIGGGAVKAAPARVAAAALVGGTVSELTGGKFGNGAMQAAFSRAFNEELHQRHGAWPADNQFDPNEPSYHRYTEVNKICDISQAGCTVDNVGGVMLDGFNAPSFGLLPQAAAAPGVERLLWASHVPGANLPGTYTLPGGIITQQIDSRIYMATNITTPKHPLYPGLINRMIVESGGSVWSVTHGVGYNRYIGRPGAMLNNGVGPLMFRDQDRALQRAWRRAYGN